MSHDEQSRQVLKRVLAHPALAGAGSALADNVLAVGGVVRDALLERAPGRDVDLVVDGDPAPVARSLASRLGAELTPHLEFRAAEILRSDGHVLDIVGARAERYPQPGVLPDVRVGTLSEDLARRDFSINAMAIRLSGPSAGEIVDAHHGRADLATGLVRVLHPGSFVDDPSRVVRAARYGAQLGFEFDPDTGQLAATAAGALDPTNARTQAELVRLLEEPEAPEALARLGDLGVPWLKPRGELVPAATATAAAVARLGLPLNERAGPLLAAAISAAPAVLGLPGPLARRVASAVAGAEVAQDLGLSPRMSEVDRALDGRGAAAAVAALAAGCDGVLAWWPKRDGATLEITGADILEAGVGAGPAVGHGLAAARAASLDGDVPDRDSQLEIAIRAARSESQR